MLNRLFKRWRKKTSLRPDKAASAYVDSDETIVINMSAEEHFEPDEVRVQIDENASEPELVEQTPAASAVASDATSPANGDHTQVWTAGEVTSDRATPVARAPASSSAIDVSLTAGLLILTEGPQCGRIFAVNLGRNKIGRGPENDIVLDTGDAAISKDDHLIIAADPKTRRYFLVPGNSTNLAYIDEQPLLESREITDRALIQIGGTKLKFIQLFGRYLDWS